MSPGRRLGHLLLVVAAAAPVAAVGAGPLEVLLEPEERAAWAAADAEQAGRLAALFWARRDPTPETADNPVRDEIESRIAFADARFAEPGRRGSLTARGRVFVGLGPPNRVRAGGPRPTDGAPYNPLGGKAGDPHGDTFAGDLAHGAATEQRYQAGAVAARETWSYRAEDLPAALARRRLDVRFEAAASGEHALADAVAVEPLLVAAAAARVLHGQEAAAAALRAPRAGRLTPAAGAPVAAGVLAAGATGGGGMVAAPFRQRDGDWLVSVHVAPARDVRADATMVVVVRRAEGEAEPADLVFAGPAEWQERSGERFLQETLSLPPGRYDVHVGLVEGGEEVAWAATDEVEVPAAAAGPWLSELVVAATVEPRAAATAAAGAPWTFRGVSVLPRADGRVAPGEELWLYAHLCDPPLGEDGGPLLAATLEVVGPRRFRGPFAATPVAADAGCWVLAESLAIDSESFPPGDYALRLEVAAAGAVAPLANQGHFVVLPR